LSYKLLRDARVYGVLLRIDRALAAEVRSGGCFCGGRLHSARYPRQAGCGLDLRKLDPEHGCRFSFCCDRDGCRKRSTPPSVRFLGRRVFLGAVVVLLAALAEVVTESRLRRLRRLVGNVSLRTIERWLLWWRETFPKSRVWKESKARFVPAVETNRLPASLLERFDVPDEYGGLVAVLELLAPLTTTSYPRGS
jgi:hypothetical protein